MSYFSSREQLLLLLLLGDSQISIPYLPGGHLILDIFPLASTSKL
jgi:hypothetical protein